MMTPAVRDYLGERLDNRLHKSATETAVPSG